MSASVGPDNQPMTILRHSRKDLAAILVCVAYPSLLLGAAACFDRLGTLEVVGVGLALAVLWQSGSYAYHHHNHLNFFVGATANRAFELVCSAGWRMPVSREAFYHFIHHTPGFLSTRDEVYNGSGRLRGIVGHVGLLSVRTTFYNLFDAFGLRWLMGVLAKLLVEVPPPRTPQRFGWRRVVDDDPWEWTAFARSRGQQSQMLGECLAVSAFSAVLAWLSPTFFLCVYLPLHWLSYAVYDYMDYSEHFLTELRHEETMAVSSYGWLYNLVMFNGGHHAEHHWREGLHWTRMPEVRRQLSNSVRRRVVPYSTLLSPLLPSTPLVGPGSMLRREAIITVEDEAEWVRVVAQREGSPERSARFPLEVAPVARAIAASNEPFHLEALGNDAEVSGVPVTDWLRRVRAVDLVFGSSVRAAAKRRQPFPHWANYLFFG